MSCFWTDFVGCSEDCDSAPPVGGDAYLLMPTNSLDGNEIGAYVLAPGTPLIGPLTLTAADVYRATDFAACSWINYMPAVHGEATDSDAPPMDGYPSQTFKPMSFFLPGSEPVRSFSGTLVFDDFDSGTATGSIWINHVLTAVGYDNSSNDFAGGVFVLTFTDSTSIEYTAAAVFSTCF